MVNDEIDNLKKRYKQSRDLKIGEKVFTPCLKACSLYRRGTGTFGSSAFKNYLGAIGNIVSNDTKLEIISSMNGIADDHKLFSAIKGTKDEYGRNKILQDYYDKAALIVVGCQGPNSGEYFQKLIAYLIANQQLKIKFALPLKEGEISDDYFSQENIKQRAMYHCKYGYYLFPGKDKPSIAFEGSVNETDTALYHNGEHVTLFKSWNKNELDDVKAIKEMMDADWEEKNEDFRFFTISEKTIDIIKEYSKKHNGNDRPIPPKSPINKPPQAPPTITDEHKWRHKKEALNIFLEKKVGILAMATGTGKTSTSINIANRLFKDKLIDSVIVTMQGNPLLSQWDESLLDDEEMRKRIVIKHFDGQWQMQQFIRDSKDKVLLITSDKLGDFMKFFPEVNAKRALVIYDEVHDMGAPERQNSTRGLHQKFTYRLGLSATPDRGKFDEEGTAFLSSEIGPIIFEFTLEDAIKRGILVEFDYKPLYFDLSEEEKVKVRNIYGAYKSKDPNKKMSQKDMAIRISNVKKTSENMLLAFDDYLKREGKKCLDRSIIFVHSEDFGEKVSQIINERGFTSFNPYINVSGTENLEKLASGRINCLITCHKVSQGIDLSSLNSIIIFSSSVNPRETIQRLGRALRTEPENPSKKAFCLDFCVVDDEEEGREKPDNVRSQWLTELATTKKEN